MRWRLKACWYILRGLPVAYRIRIENGGLVIDAGDKGLYRDLSVTGPELVADLATGEARCPTGTCVAAGQAAITVLNMPGNVKF
jgi:hypothetical protein